MQYELSKEIMEKSSNISKRAFIEFGKALQEEMENREKTTGKEMISRAEVIGLYFSSLHLLSLNIIIMWEGSMKIFSEEKPSKKAFVYNLFNALADSFKKIEKEEKAMKGKH